METEKIGTVSLYEVKLSARRHYINLDRLTVETYDIKPGDMLKVEIQAKVKKQGAEA